jgi:hypothetical protein
MKKEKGQYRASSATNLPNGGVAYYTQSNTHTSNNDEHTLQLLANLYPLHRPTCSTANVTPMTTAAIHSVTRLFSWPLPRGIATNSW